MVTAANPQEDGQAWRRWKRSWEPASFRGCRFFVEADSRASGRRVAVHQYPKRNTPYAEDMGRAAIRVHVNGYLIGSPGNENGAGEADYLQMKDELIAALEADGPGVLRLPMQYQTSDLMVMVMSYAVAESRERGGMCTVEMDFIEYGDPAYRTVISTAGAVMKSATAAEQAVTPRALRATAAEVEPFAEIHRSAEIGA